MLELVAVALGGLVTFLTRVAFLVTRKVRPPKRVERYLPLVGPAVLGAIALPGLVAPRGEISLVDTIPALVTAVVTLVIWRLTRQTAIALLVGLLLWWGILAVMVFGFGVER